MYGALKRAATPHSQSHPPHTGQAVPSVAVHRRPSFFPLEEYWQIEVCRTPDDRSSQWTGAIFGGLGLLRMCQSTQNTMAANTSGRRCIGSAGGLLVRGIADGRQFIGGSVQHA